ncbi:MAG: phosphatase PAP2 family protein [Bdellovibrio sp.]
MFEYKIQEAWEKYREDFGLGRILLFVYFFNGFITFLSYFVFGYFDILPILPVVAAFFFYFFRPQVARASSLMKTVINMLPIAITIILNYYYVGVVDRLAGGLPRMDEVFVKFEYWLYGDMPAVLIENILRPAGFLGSFMYDLMMTGYILYFLIPIHGAILIYRILPDSRRYKLSRYFGSVILYYTLNYLFYLFIPVTGPQYFLPELFNHSLPFSSYGHFLYNSVQTGQATFIDCFPSGHTGIAWLVTIWLFRFNHYQRYLMVFVTVLIMLATLAMRYHYTLDLLAAIPLALITYKMGQWLFPVEVGPQVLRSSYR